MDATNPPLSDAVQKVYASIKAVLLQSEKEKEPLLEHIRFLENTIQDQLKNIESLKISCNQISQEKEEVVHQNQTLRSENQTLRDENQVLQNTIQKQQEKFKETETLQKKVDGLKSFLDSQLLCTLEYKRRISTEGETFERKLALLLSELDQKELRPVDRIPRKMRRWKKALKNLTFSSSVGAGCYFLEQSIFVSAWLGIAILVGWIIYNLKNSS